MQVSGARTSAAVPHLQTSKTEEEYERRSGVQRADPQSIHSAAVNPDDTAENRNLDAERIETGSESLDQQVVLVENLVYKVDS